MIKSMSEAVRLVVGGYKKVASPGWLREMKAGTFLRRQNMKIFSRGFIYRTGQRIKDFGERLNRKKVFGVAVFRWACGPLVKLGLTIRDAV